MNEEFNTQGHSAEAGEKAENKNSNTQRNNPISNWFEMLAHLGLGESLFRYGTHAISLIVIAIVAWMINGFFSGANTPQDSNAESVSATATPIIQLASITLPENPFAGIGRETNLRTIIPDRPRTEIEMYTVQKGDTVTSIAEKYGLKPQTILNANAFTRMADNPHNLFVDQEVIILPIDGVYWQWQSGESLTAWAKTFKVTVEDIVNYPANNLDLATLGSYDNPNIEPGTMLVIPNGFRIPNARGDVFIGVTRTTPATSRVQGPGACGSITDGAIGIGSFIWPADHHWLSGYDWSPDTGHRGVDIDGETGDPIYAVDYGVIVYAGWNDWGYGNMIMIDHGTGWQSLYAHLSSINVICGASVLQGAVIGAIGSTGNSSGSHLHFELMNSQYGKVNPWLYLPPP